MTHQGDHPLVPANMASTMEFQRQLEAVLVRGNQAAAEGRLDDGQHYYDTAVVTFNALSTAVDREFRLRMQARIHLLGANLLAFAYAPRMTSDLHGRYAVAIEAARMHAAEPGSSDEVLGRAHRSYGTVLAFYGQYGHAITELEVAAGLLRDDERGDNDLWLMAAIQLAQVYLARNAEAQAIPTGVSDRSKALALLQLAVAAFDAHTYQAPFIRAPHVAAAALYSRSLWHAGQRRESKKWRRKAAVHAQRLCESGNLDHDDMRFCRMAIRLGKMRVRWFEAWLAHQPRVIEI